MKSGVACACTSTCACERVRGDVHAHARVLPVRVGAHHDSSAAMWTILRSSRLCAASIGAATRASSARAARSHARSVRRLAPRRAERGEEAAAAASTVGEASMA
eukprot:4727705-Pleurochrysis_carterae.AAC.3